MSKKTGAAIFFYETARLEDIYGRFLQGMLALVFLTNRDRKELKKMFYEQMEGFFKIRNIMTHGEIEWGKKDREIQFLATLDKRGYASRLVFKDGREELEFDKDIRNACSTRANLFLKYGQDIGHTMSNYVSITARWLNLNGYFDINTE